MDAMVNIRDDYIYYQFRHELNDLDFVHVSSSMLGTESFQRLYMNTN